MNQTNHLNRLCQYGIFSLGALICSVGITFITRAGLGTSPVSSIPFVISLITKSSMGIFTFSFNILFLICESLLIKKFGLAQILQLLATGFFSLCIDLSMSLIPSRYGGPWADSLVYLLIGCAIMALGITLELKGNVIMLPAEAFVRALSQKLNMEFGNVKVCFDSTLTVIASILALVALGQLNGVREGTVISALLVGQLVRLYGVVERGFRKLCTR